MPKAQRFRSEKHEHIWYHWPKVCAKVMLWSTNQAEQARKLICEAAKHRQLYLIAKESNTQFIFAWVAPWGDEVLVVYDSLRHLPKSVHRQAEMPEYWAQAEEEYFAPIRRSTHAGVAPRPAAALD